MTLQEYNVAFKEHWLFILNLANSIINNRMDAEDITSRSFEVLWLHADEVPIEKAKAYLCVITTNKCKDLLTYCKRNPKWSTLEEDIVIEDQIPVANDKEISVDKIDDSNAEYNGETGFLKWKKQIDPGETTVVNLKYAVRYPKTAVMILE